MDYLSTHAVDSVRLLPGDRTRWKQLAMSTSATCSIIIAIDLATVQACAGGMRYINVALVVSFVRIFFFYSLMCVLFSIRYTESQYQGSRHPCGHAHSMPIIIYYILTTFATFLRSCSSFFFSPPPLDKGSHLFSQLLLPVEHGPVFCCGYWDSVWY